MNEALGSVLTPAGPVAGMIAGLSWVLVIGATLIFGVVMALLAWTLLRPPAGRDVHHGASARFTWRWVVGGGIIFPVVVLSALLLYNALRTDALTPPRAGDELVISVTGRMWWWEVRYQLPAAGIDFVTANQIHLPAGRPVTLGVTTADVIHSLWLPALAGKMDMVPGRVYQLRLQADRPGRFRGQCTEYCGIQHARMGLHAVAMEPAAFEQWLAQQASGAQPPDDAQLRRGLEVFAEQRCHQCHALRGVGLATGLNVAPDLTHLASRSHLAAGVLELDQRSIAAWVADPQRYKPGVRMPSYDHLDPASLQALASFLAQLR